MLDHLASAQRIPCCGEPSPLTIHAFGDQKVGSKVLKVGKTHRSIFHTVAIMTMSLSRWKVSNLPYKHPFLFLPSFFCLSIVFCFLPLLHPQGLKMFFFLAWLIFVYFYFCVLCCQTLGISWALKLLQFPKPIYHWHSHGRLTPRQSSTCNLWACPWALSFPPLSELLLSSITKI